MRIVFDTNVLVRAASRPDGVVNKLRSVLDGTPLSASAPYGVFTVEKI